eukprot:9862548-Ditylum_brightwellii.AAC.1
MYFDPVEPVDTIFTEIVDLTDIADLAKDPITKCQKFLIGYIILQRTLKFSSSLGRWNDKPDVQKTWVNFQTHFRKAQTDLHQTGSLTVKDGINHTEMINMVAACI